MSKSSTDENFNDEAIQMAEAALTGSVVRFEEAMDALAKRIDATMDAFQRVSHAIDVPKEKFNEIRDTVVGVLKPLAPYYALVSASVFRLFERAKKNPRPYLITAGALVSGVVLYRYFLRKRQNSYLEQGQELH